MKSLEHRLDLFLDRKGVLREDFICISMLEDVRNKFPYNQHCSSQQELQSQRQLTSLVSQFLGDFSLPNSEHLHKISEAKEGLPFSENKTQKHKNETGKDRLLKLKDRSTKRERRN